MGHVLEGLNQLVTIFLLDNVRISYTNAVFVFLLNFK